MAKVKTIANTIDQLIFDYKGKPKYILLDVDNYLRFKEELIALNLYKRTDLSTIDQKESVIFRYLKVLVVFDEEIIEVVG
jgi:hypothetical protein